MKSLLTTFRFKRRPKLPWRALEAEARRQGCSPADIFFDLAGHMRGEPDSGTVRSPPMRSLTNRGLLPRPSPKSTR